MGAAIAQWIRLSLPSSHPGFESQAYHLCFFQIIYLSFELGCEKNENKQKEAGIGPFKKNFFPLSGFKKTKIWLSRKVLYIKMGQTWPPFVYFRSFHMTKYSTNLTINCKHRWYAWDSNPELQDGRSRWIHWAIESGPMYVEKLRPRFRSIWHHSQHCTWIRSLVLLKEYSV